MTYYDIIQAFFTAGAQHKMIADVGYGPISDIKTRSQNAKPFVDSEGETEGVDYPYMFLNPTTSQRTGAAVTYSFNLIMMDMAWQEVPNNLSPTDLTVSRYTNEAQVQSQCQQYIDDIVGHMYHNTGLKAEISMDIQYTPFVERFQDSVAGMTAQIKITVPQAIDDCIAPFE